MSRFVLDKDMLTLVQEGHPTVSERLPKPANDGHNASSKHE